MQLSFIKKPVIYHISLTSVYEECPNCHAINKATEDKYNKWTDSYYKIYYASCPKCGQLFDWDEEAVEKATKYSKEYKQAMKDVPEGGPVVLLPNGHYGRSIR